MKIHELLENGVDISSQNIPGQLPIMRFRKDAAAIQASLPPVPPGITRLWRGNRHGEIGNGTQFTSDLAGIALPFREPYGGDISFIDIPTEQVHLYLNNAGAAPGVEFSVPREIAATAKPVGVRPGGIAL